MSVSRILEALRMQLVRDGLVLCKTEDAEKLSLDGEKETFALMELAAVAEEAAHVFAVDDGDEWDIPTREYPLELVEKLAVACLA